MRSRSYLEQWQRGPGGGLRARSDDEGIAAVGHRHPDRCGRPSSSESLTENPVETSHWEHLFNLLHFNSFSVFEILS